MSQPVVRSLDQLQLELQTRDQATHARATLRTWLGQSLTGQVLDDVLLGSGEAIANALEHGMPPVSIDVRWIDTRQLAIEIFDQGPWKERSDAIGRGRGLSIMRSVMDDVTVDTSGGTRVFLRRHFT